MELSVEMASPIRAVQQEQNAETEEVLASTKQQSTIKGGWKIMPFIIGSEFFANVGLTSLFANLVVFLSSEYDMDRLTAAKIATIWGGINYLAPIVGTFIADSYLGRFWAIALGSVTYILALSLVTFISLILPQIRGSGYDSGLLFAFLMLMVVGSSGKKSCALYFGSEQFHNMDAEGRKQQQSFFNWYYFTTFESILVGGTVLVYIQSNVSWIWGYGVATILMIISTGFFLLASKHYIKVSPEGSALTIYAQVIVASIRKRNLAVPSESTEFNNIHLVQEGDPKLYLTDKFKFLNKAAIIIKEDFEGNVSKSNPWTLCTIEKIEELKSVISVLPIWGSGIVVATILVGPSHTYMIYQAQFMQKNIGPNFKIPEASYPVFSLLAISIWLPLQDRMLLPFFRRLIKPSQGVAVTEKIGTGLIISVVAMAVAALVEVKRKESKVVISGFWLAPQFILMGLAEAFYAVGMLEFLYVQFKQSMRCVAVALFWSRMGIGLLMSTIMITLVHKATGGDGHHGWLAQNLNEGRLERFYWLLCGLGILNFFYFLVCTRFVRYPKELDEGGNEELGFRV